MLRVLKITGQSLTPKYLEGDFVIISKIPFFFISPKPGDVIAFTHPAYGIMIKRIDKIDPTNGNLFVIGSHPASIDSRDFGSIPKHANLGKVIWNIRRPRPQ